ncbi:tRNA 2-thiouridine(34) synthase MnmA [Blautia wexlerae]|uniref:tRNA 2-thiouridine(34) synthase MnmA n=1 Tax=Blautia wexlerae TaxID=418240 RepID=UPI0018A88F17|nr:tRNA 2-thiouridine(34) synthase MnmA [Blautia wexlerae]MDB6468761.1 tRNA 2-thiouridine(34) synthase MnmA [Blautia wexlerae]
MRKAIIAMSGGVDSSVAALLTKETGDECIGATMKLFHNEDIGVKREKTCCSLDDVEDARNVCYRMGIRYYVFNFSERFKEDVMDRFVDAYEHGATPNPCIDCNRYLKFDKMFQRMRELEYDYIVTGHYARVEYDEEKNRYLLKKAVDDTKDQSYVLYMLTQEQLAHISLPLGGLCKTEVREIAEKHGFVNARKHDSQDICFVPDGDYAKFIEQYTGRKSIPGDFVDTEGNILGKHKGIIHYTLGQRRGLGIPAASRLYVCDISPKTNQVVLGNNEDLFHLELTATKVNLISCESLKEPMRLKAKIRYRHPEQEAVAWQTEDGVLHVRFDKPQRAITRGQAVVLYDGDIVVGGGVIENCIK